MSNGSSTKWDSDSGDYFFLEFTNITFAAVKWCHVRGHVHSAPRAFSLHWETGIKWRIFHSGESLCCSSCSDFLDLISLYLYTDSSLLHQRLSDGFIFSSQGPFNCKNKVIHIIILLQTLGSIFKGLQKIFKIQLEYYPWRYLQAIMHSRIRGLCWSYSVSCDPVSRCHYD